MKYFFYSLIFYIGILSILSTSGCATSHTRGQYHEAKRQKENRRHFDYVVDDVLYAYNSRDKYIFCLAGAKIHDKTEKYTVVFPRESCNETCEDQYFPDPINVGAESLTMGCSSVKKFEPLSRSYQVLGVERKFLGYYETVEWMQDKSTYNDVIFFSKSNFPYSNNVLTLVRKCSCNKSILIFTVIIGENLYYDVGGTETLFKYKLKIAAANIFDVITLPLQIIVVIIFGIH